MPFDLTAIRARFPALARTENGVPVAWLDGPAGTQVPLSVIEATKRVQQHGVANLGGGFGASRDASSITDEARSAVGDLFGADPGQVVFGHNMTTLTFALSRAIAREWSPGDRVVVTTLDHDANVAPWVMAAAEADADVARVNFDPLDGTLDPAAVVASIDDRTRLVAVTAASNALGSVTDLTLIIAAAHEVGALVYIDAVHFSAHRLCDVRALGADFLVASAYKFFGPHIGLAWLDPEHLERLKPYKVLPAPDTGPERWETGTQPFETLVGITAAVDYLASLGVGSSRRDCLESAFAAIGEHETKLADQFIAGIARTPSARIYGPPTAGPHRVSTFAISVEGLAPATVAQQLWNQGIYVWAGHYYAIGVMKRLGLLDTGGLTRIGFVHYNTPDEVDRVLEALATITA